MTTTEQYTNPSNPFSATPEDPFGPTFDRLIAEASACDDPEAEAQMAWDAVAFAAACFVRNSDGEENLDSMSMLFVMTAAALYAKMAELATGSYEDDSEDESEEA